MDFFDMIKNRRRAKDAKKRAPRKAYLLDKNTPFAVTEAFRNLKASISVSVPISKKQ